MKRILVSIISLLVLISSNSNANAQKSSLSISVDGWDNDTIYILTYSWQNKKEAVETLVAKNGVIDFRSPNPNDTIEVILSAKKSCVARERGVPLILEATTIKTLILGDSWQTINGKLNGRKLEYTSEGSLPMFKEMAQLHSSKLELLAQKDDNERKIEADAKPDFFDIRRQYNTALRKIESEFIANNRESQYSGRLVLESRMDDFYANYNLLDDKVKNGIFCDKFAIIKRRVDDYNGVKRNKELTKVGSTAPSFELRAIDGGNVKLETLRGKWVLVDFWGSWCGWCIKGFPELKEFATKYGSRVEVIGIACNDTEVNWRKAVEKHELKWINLLSDKKVQVDYAVEAYPTKILIDPEGKIVLRESGESDDLYIKMGEKIDTKL